ncbi:MAG: histidyl-tRNA synthase [Ferruginibacter sp.]|nr:histidyl-tRNA synthase [Ferruginibacter sp.]
MSKPSIPQGTRDFSAETVQKRNYILNTIRTVFELYGFQPLETPAMEKLETLMGKYGEEGDKLIFKILNNGLAEPQNADKAKAGFDKLLQGKNTADLTERALKYDLTIPFARYVAMNHGQLTFPFKRYQIQPVWRADKPQRGRYREFTQCDADVVGSNALVNEVELAFIYHTVFTKLGLKDYTLKINSRKLLAALAELCGGTDKMMDITMAIDKLDKIGLEKVKAELEQRGLTAAQIERIETYLAISGNNDARLTALEKLFEGNDIAAKGIEELRTVAGRTKNINLQIDLTLARGLNYYTGVIFEVKGPEQVKMGSIGGGGRYDDLTGLFGVPDIPGVGISFGVDRIYDVIEELGLFPAELQLGSKALFFNLGEAESQLAFEQMQLLRDAGVACEMFHEQAKMDKQFKYADKKNIPYVIIIGEREAGEKKAMLKELKTGKQEAVAFDELAAYLQLRNTKTTK